MNSSDEIHCRMCSKSIHQSQRFCSHCGNKVDDTLTKVKICTGTIDGNACENEIDSAMKFCCNCGTKNDTYIAESGAGIDKEKTEKSVGSRQAVGGNNSEEEDLLAKLKKDGVLKVTAHVREKLDEFNNIKTKIAVIGRSAVGKSSFINMMLDLKQGSTCFAKTGSGDTTKTMHIYRHPKNENITFWDMPGCGTLQMTKERFCSEFGSQLKTFDYFFLFIDTVIMEDDVWLVKQIKSHNIPYSFVRSKLDEDIKQGRTMENIRKKLEGTMQANDTIAGSDLFLMSNNKSYFYTVDFRQLFARITEQLPSAQAESLSFFLPILTPEAINQKYNTLKERIAYVALQASIISAIPVPLIDIPVNIYLIREEIQEYSRVFLFDREELKNVTRDTLGVRSKYNTKEKILTTFKACINITTMGAFLMSQTDVLVPGVGSCVAAASTYNYASAYLLQVLTEMKEDADRIYEHFTNVK